MKTRILTVAVFMTMALVSQARGAGMDLTPEEQKFAGECVISRANYPTTAKDFCNCLSWNLRRATPEVAKEVKTLVPTEKLPPAAKEWKQKAEGICIGYALNKAAAVPNQTFSASEGKFIESCTIEEPKTPPQIAKPLCECLATKLRTATPAVQAELQAFQPKEKRKSETNDWAKTNMQVCFQEMMDRTMNVTATASLCALRETGHLEDGKQVTTSSSILEKINGIENDTEEKCRAQCQKSFDQYQPVLPLEKQVRILRASCFFKSKDLGMKLERKLK